MSAPTYPAAGLEHHHGRRVWELGEDGDQFVVEGHGRRALAAFSAFARYAYGALGLARPDHTADMHAREGHAEFARTCGCTREDHDAGHPRPAEDGGTVKVDCWELCDPHGLPPCRDGDWGFIALDVVEGPDTLPVTWIRVPR